MTKRVVLLCADTDAGLRDDLAKVLLPMISAGACRLWHEGLVGAGEDREQMLGSEVETAHILLVMLTAEMLADEARMALVRFAKHLGQRIVPVLVRECGWRYSSCARLQVLPRNLSPVTSRRIRSSAWNEVATELDKILRELPADAPGEGRTIERAQGEPTRAAEEPKDQIFSGTLDQDRSILKGRRAGPPLAFTPSNPPANARWLRASTVRRVVQLLIDPRTAGIGLLEPFGFGARRIVESAVSALRASKEPCIAVRLVPDRRCTSPERLYRALLRDLFHGLDAAIEGLSCQASWQDALPTEEGFETVLVQLLQGPLLRAGKTLLLAVEGLARVTAEHLQSWGYLMARLCRSAADFGPAASLKLLVWGGQELDDLLTRPAGEGYYSVFHDLTPILLEPFGADDVEQLVIEQLGPSFAARVSLLHAETGGHPALLQELLQRDVEVAREGSAASIRARILQGEHVQRLRRALDAEKETLRLLSVSAPFETLERTNTAEEQRLKWLGILRARDAGWVWTAPLLRSLGK